MYDKKRFLIIISVLIISGLCWIFLRPQFDKSLSEHSEDLSNNQKIEASLKPISSEIVDAKTEVLSENGGEKTVVGAQQEIHPTEDGAKTAIDVNGSQIAPNTALTKSREATAKELSTAKGDVSRNISFPGIKQEKNPIMLSALDYIPGDEKDSFVATFKRVDQKHDGHATVWLIAEYVQRGTTGIMTMASHDGLKLNAAGVPQNSSVGSRVVFDGLRGELIRKTFSITRPGFEGEELTAVRIGIFDSGTAKLHIARVSAIQLMKNRSKKRATVISP